MGYVITNVRVLDGTGGAPFPGTVRVDGNRIVEVTRGAGSAPPAGASVLDGAGVAFGEVSDDHHVLAVAGWHAEGFGELA